MSPGRRGALSRREALRRAGLLAVSAGMPFSFTACAELEPAIWQLTELEPIDVPGYGTDPDLVHPQPAPWPRTLTDHQLDTVAVLVDILIPPEGKLPGATEVGVVEVIDEWVSAPYPVQREHRNLLLSGLDWCDAESRHRYDVPLTGARARQQLAIIEDIAYPEITTAPELAGPRQFFDTLRRLATGAYYTSPAGVAELGYEGNRPISGMYPGPTPEAMAHLQARLAELGLTL